MILLFIVVYLISSFLSSYALLSKYEWYNNLAVKLYFYEGKLKPLLNKIYYFKLFICQSCITFWISLMIHFVLTYFIVYDYTIYALLTFLIHKIETKNV
jgi:hypothetical protein